MDPTPGGVVQEVECYRVPLDPSRLFAPRLATTNAWLSKSRHIRSNLNPSDGCFRGWVANQAARVLIPPIFIFRCNINRHTESDQFRSGSAML
jgi:hypothetical protein